MLAIARTATAMSADRPSWVTAWTTTSSAASAATLDTPARNTVIGSGEPAYVVGVQAWKGTSESLNAMPPRTRTTARASSPRCGVEVAARAGPGPSSGEPVAAYQHAAPRASMANETSEVVTSWTAPARARRVPGSAARATTGSVASSRVTSQEARSRAPATPTAPPVAARSRETVTAVRPVSSARSDGHASSRVTAAASRAASWSVVDSAVAE